MSLPKQFSLCMFNHPLLSACTSRDDITRALCALIETKPAEIVARNAMILLTRLGTLPSEAFLRFVGGDHAYWVRSRALSVFIEGGSVLPLNVFVSLLDALSLETPAMLLCCPGCDPGDTWHVPLGPRLVLAVARGAEQESLACAWLDRATLAVRRSIWIRPSDRFAPSVFDRFVKLGGGAKSVHGDERAPQIAFRSPDEILVFDASANHNPNVTGLRFVVQGDIASMSSDGVILRDEATRQGAAHFSDVVVRDEAAMRSAIDETVREMSLPKGEGEWHPFLSPEQPSYQRALGFLRSSPNAAELAERILLEVALPEVIANDVALVLFERDRGRAFDMAMSKLIADQPFGLYAVLYNVARAPLVRERARLRQFAHSKDEFVCYRVVDALEGLGESDDSWLDQLRAFAQRGGPLLRARALGALARRGEPGAEGALVEVATVGDSLPARCEALCRLGELESASKHFALFEPPLFFVKGIDSAPDTDDWYAADTDDWQTDTANRPGPECDAAAQALHRIGDTRALVALLRAALIDYTIEQSFESVLARRFVDLYQQHLLPPAPYVRRIGSKSVTASGAAANQPTD